MLTAVDVHHTLDHTNQDLLVLTILVYMFALNK